MQHRNFATETIWKWSKDLLISQKINNLKNIFLILIATVAQKNEPIKNIFIIINNSRVKFFVDNENIFGYLFS